MRVVRKAVQPDGENAGSQQFCPAQLDVAGFDFDPLKDDLLEIFACGADALGKLPDAIAVGNDAPPVGAEGYPLAIVRFQIIYQETSPGSVGRFWSLLIS